MILQGPCPGEPAVVEAVLRSLPDWFGIEQAVLDYVASAPSLDTWTAADGDGVRGFLCVKRHFAHAAEIHVMGVRPEHHRQGIGARLVSAAEAHLRADGVRMLQVKTLSPARAYEPYARTRAFYEACGFLPLEDLDALCQPGNPCRLYVKHLA